MGAEDEAVPPFAYPNTPEGKPVDPKLTLVHKDRTPDTGVPKMGAMSVAPLFRTTEPVPVVANEVPHGPPVPLDTATPAPGYAVIPKLAMVIVPAPLVTLIPVPAVMVVTV